MDIFDIILARQGNSGGGGGSGSGGYDAVIKIQYDWEEKTYSAEITSGSFDALLKKLQAGTLPAVEGFVDNGDYFPINVATIAGNEDEIVICFENSTSIPGAGFVCYLTADSVGVETEDMSWAKYDAVISVNTSVLPNVATVRYGEFEVVKQLALSGAPMNIAVVDSGWSSSYNTARTYSVEAELSNYIIPTHGEYYIAIHATCGMGNFGEYPNRNVLIVWYEDGTVTIENYA